MDDGTSLDHVRVSRQTDDIPRWLFQQKSLRDNIHYKDTEQEGDAVAKHNSPDYYGNNSIPSYFHFFHVKLDLPITKCLIPPMGPDARILSNQMVSLPYLAVRESNRSFELAS